MMKIDKRTSDKKLLSELERLYILKKQVEEEYKIVADEVKRRYPNGTEGMTDKEKEKFSLEQFNMFFVIGTKRMVDTNAVKERFPDWETWCLKEQPQCEIRMKARVENMGSRK